MDLTLFQIDAFTNQLFLGNPACVVLLDSWLSDDQMLAMAAENAVAETAFIVEQAGRFQLRWFTPDIEMDLCGHATLAAGHAVLHHLHPDWLTVHFDTLSGPLLVIKEDTGYRMDLPNRPPVESLLPEAIENALSRKPTKVLKGCDYVLVYDDEHAVRSMQIDRPVFDQINLGTGGVIVTAPGESCDFVSRFFTPQATILEDPVTGSAHCSLVPYWSEIFGKTELTAQQLSARGGFLNCRLVGDRVHLIGEAVTTLQGTIQLD
ncbi:MAG: PhzF family phenazine biosynthesis protein [Bacteroidetes bacterium]|jgi:PhzF family phenazine biosynthesis protein|nr:PhzF family phenazine biosynthesis protein [Bacteroidota bacterium]